MFLQSLSLIVFYLYENNAIKFVFEIERNIPEFRLCGSMLAVAGQ